MAYYDFDQIKKDVSIERSLIYLKLKFKKDDNGWRAECPQCGGERSLAINPIKNVYYCHEADKGGDVLSFVSHVLNIGVKDAAKFLLEHSGKTEAKKTSQVSPVKKGTVPQKTEKGTSTEVFQPLSHLFFEHGLVQDMGISAADAEALGIGYTNRGLLKGHVCIPVRLADGSLAGYVGVHGGKVPSTWHYLKTNVVPLKRRA